MSGRTVAKVLLGFFVLCLVASFAMTVTYILTDQIHTETVWHHRLGNLTALMGFLGCAGTLILGMGLSEL